MDPNPGPGNDNQKASNQAQNQVQGPDLTSGLPGTSRDIRMEGEAPANIDDFLNTGRTGRRNAVPDIIEDTSAKVSTADLPAQMGKLTCSGT